MLMHAHNVVGVEVFFGPLAAVLAWDVMPKLPMTAKRLQRSTAEHKKSGAMLLPRGAEDQWTTCCRRGARAPNAPSSRSPAPSRRLLESVF